MGRRGRKGSGSLLSRFSQAWPSRLRPWRRGYRLQGEGLEERRMLSNFPPAANDDMYLILNHNDTLNAWSVLMNDSDPDWDSLTAQIVSGPSHAQTFNFNSDGTFTYKAAANWAGVDGFTYEALDGTDADEGYVQIIVQNATPIAVEEGYNIDHATLTIGAPGVLSGDTDGDGDSLTAVVDDSPSHAAAFSLNSNGSFSYTPRPGFTGQETFTYRAFDGIDYSSPVQVTINVKNLVGDADIDQNQDPTCECECMCGPALELEPSSGFVGLDLGRLFGLRRGSLPVYNLRSIAADPIIRVRIPFAGALPDTLKAQLTYGGLQDNEVNLNATSEFANQEGLVALQMDASSLAAGTYAWSVLLSGEWSGGVVTDSYTVNGVHHLFGRQESEFGSGFWVPNLDRLAFSSGGVSVLRGDGSAAFYEDDNGDLLTPAGSFAPLVENGNGTYTLTLPDGAERVFSASGLLLSETDLNGNVTSYTYTDADSDSVADELAEIEDPFGRTYSYTYTSGLLSAIEDFAGRDFAFSHDSNGRLEEVTGPDPDGAGPLAAPVVLLGYDTSDRLTSVTDPRGETTTVSYGASGRATGLLWPDSQSRSLAPIDVLALDTLILYDEALAEEEDERGKTWETGTDKYGRTTKIVDPLGNVTRITRDNNGLVTQRTDPDPDGPTNPLAAPVTQFQYDAHGRLLEITLPDNSTQSWTYSTSNTLHLPLTMTDELEREWEYAYDTAGNLTEVTDPLGKVTTYAYNSAGQVASITLPDPDGAGSQTSPVTTFQYDVLGRLEKITHPDSTYREFDYDTADNLILETDERGNETAYTHDAFGRVLTVTAEDPDGAGPLTSPVTSFTYDAMGNVLTVTDPLGNVTTHEYDDRGRLKKLIQEDPDGAGPLTAPETLYGYDAAGNLTSVTDPRGHVTTHAYNDAGWLTSITLPDPDGGGSLTSPVIAFGYDHLGRRTSTTDPLGNITSFQYDILSRLTKTIQPDPDGAGSQTAPETSLTYDAVGNVLTVTNALGHVTTNEYDDLNRVVSVTLPDPDGAGSQTAPETTYAYDALGRMISTTDPLGNVTAYAYDALSRLLTLTQADPDGAGSLTSPITTYAYDDAGNLTSVTDPLGHVTSYGYDALNRQITVTLPDPDGVGGQSAGVYTYGYDAAGNLLSVTDPLSHETAYEYDDLHRRTKITDAELGETSFTYDAIGNLLTLTDPVGNVTAWVYDALNRVIEETNELNKTRYFVYDAASNLTQRTDRNGRVIEFVYDDLHRRIEELWKDGMSTVRTLSLQYDALGRVTNASDPAAEFDYTYDNLGRRISVVHDLVGLSFDVELMSIFDAASNRTDLKALVGGTADFWNEYAYDDLHRMTSFEQHGAAGGAAVAEKRIDFTYDAAGQWDTITRYANTAATQLVATSTYTHDDAGRLIALTHAKGMNTLADYDLTYDVGNRITGVTNNVYTAESATYSYDDTNQLTAADRSGTTNDESYSYDTNGNRTNTGHTTGDNNQLTSDGTYNYTYDDEGNRLTRTHIAGGAVTEYEWDYHNRLVKITERPSSQGAATAIYDYIYDLWGRRIAKLLDTDGDSDYDSETYYIHDGERYERGNAGDHIALTFDANGDLTNRYLYGPAVDQVMAAEEVATTATAGAVLWSLGDNLNTIRDLAEHNTATDTTTVANHRAFDSFGNLTGETNAAVEFIFAFTARERDHESELYYYRARYYSSAIGLFVEEDPTGFEAGDTNLNRYVNNDVLRHLDPSGLDRRIASWYGHLFIVVDIYDDDGNVIGARALHFSPAGFTIEEVNLSGIVWLETYPSSVADDRLLLELWKLLEQSRKNGTTTSWNPFWNCWAATWTYYAYPDDCKISQTQIRKMKDAIRYKHGDVFPIVPPIIYQPARP